MAVQTITSPGAIEPNKIYHLDEAKSITRWNTSAFRAARRAGLRVRYLHGRAFVAGSDLIAYIEAFAKNEK